MCTCNISISEPAQNYFLRLIKKNKSKEKLAIRLTANYPGTEGAQCGIQYCPKSYITIDDLHFKMNGFEVVIDKLLAPFLNGSVLDLGKDDDGSDILTFHAPHLNDSQLPPDASFEDRIRAYIKFAVEPKLADHGGSVTVEEVTEDGVIKLTLSGSCLGCSMAGATMHDGIEAELKAAFPDKIKEVIDVTDHSVGSHDPFAELYGSGYYSGEDENRDKDSDADSDKVSNADAGEAATATGEDAPGADPK